MREVVESLLADSAPSAIADAAVLRDVPPRISPFGPSLPFWHRNTAVRCQG